MDTTQFYEELKAKAQEDFIDILANSNFIDGDTVELCEKITITKTMLDYIQDNLENGGTDIVALLFHKKPITAFYDWYKVKEISLLENLEEKISDFTISTKIDNEMAYAEPKFYSRYSVEKANEYHKFVASMEIDSDFEQVVGYAVENQHSNLDDSLKERYSLLQQRAEDDYGIILSNHYIQDGYVEEFAEKIIFCKMFKEYIENTIASEDAVEALLFLYNPLSSFYEHFKDESPEILDNFNGKADEFIKDMLNEIYKIDNNPQQFPESQVERAKVALMWIEASYGDIEQEQDDDMER